MLDLDNNLLYREVIMEHYKNPLNKGLVESLHVYSSKNPTCGDNVDIQIEYENDKIKAIHQKSIGCSISVSSASILTSLLKGKTKTEAVKITQHFIKMIKGEEYDTTIDFGDGIVFENIRSYPARYKCASTVWELVLKALKGEI